MGVDTGADTNYNETNMIKQARKILCPKCLKAFRKVEAEYKRKIRKNKNVKQK